MRFVLLLVVIVIRRNIWVLIDETKEELKTLGFDKFCTFDMMKPTFHKL